MVFSVCKRKSYEPSVQNGLSLTPSEMSALIAKGVPVSTSNLSLNYDSSTVSDNDFSVPADMRRGADMSDAWNAQQDSRKSLKKFRKHNVE